MKAMKTEKTPKALETLKTRPLSSPGLLRGALLLPAALLPLLLPGCGGGGPASPTGGGTSITLTLAGLPATPPACVRLVGAGVDTTVAATTTFSDVQPGTYAVIPQGVWSGGNCYITASPAQVFVVNSGDAKTLTVAYQAAGIRQEPLATDVTLNLVQVPAGTYVMGAADSLDPDAAPAHTVTLTRPFYIGAAEVTQAQWKAVMGSGNNPTPAGWQVDSQPVLRVTWSDVASFLSTLNTRLSRTGDRAYRLPTEAEWEYACRAGSAARYFYGTGDTLLGNYGWWSGSSSGVPHVPGQLRCNAWGLYDTYGNAWEWVQDWYGAYGSAAISDPTGPASGEKRVLRGGSFLSTNGQDTSRGCRSASRLGEYPTSQWPDIGFRVALTAQ